MSSITKIHTRFKIFDKDIRDIWESYCLVEMLAIEGHRLLKADALALLTMDTLFGGKKVWAAAGFKDTLLVC